MGVVPEGGYGIGVNPNGVYFPFIKEVTGAKRLFADMYLGHRKVNAVLPLKVTHIEGFTQPATSSSNGSDRAEMTIVDSDNSLVFDSTHAGEYRFKDWSNRFRIHEWISDDCVLRVVQHTGQNDSEDVLNYPYSQELTNAILDERVSELWPDSVTSLIVNGYPIKGDIEFIGGYNFETRLSSVNNKPGQSHTNKVFVSAAPGSGLGREEGCSGTTVYPVRAINGVKVQKGGNFIFSAKDCLWLNSPGTVSNIDGTNSISYELTNGFYLKNNCLPCCSCDDFVNTYQGIRRLYSKYETLGQRANAVRSKLTENTQRWLSQKNCRESDPVKVNLVPWRIKDDSGVKINVGICNTEPGCRGEMSLNLAFSTPTGLKGYINRDTVFSYESSGYNPEPYHIEGSWPNYNIKWINTKGQSLSKVKMDMLFTRTPDVTWNGDFSLLDGPNGNVVFTGRFVCVFQDSIVKEKYDLVVSVFWTDPEATLAYGFKVEKIVHKLIGKDIPKADMLNKTFNKLGPWYWTLSEEANSTNIKPFFLQLNYDSKKGPKKWFITKDDGSKVLVYEGMLYLKFGTTIPGVFVSKVQSNDFVKVDLTAKVNGETITNGTKSVVRSLKV